MIVALSGRSLAEAAAAAGRAPWVIDGFGDADTRAIAAGAVCVPIDAALQFERAPLLAAAADVERTAGPMPLVTGAGFERDPDVLEALLRNRAPAGASVSVLRALLDVPGLYERLAQVTGITVAPTRARRPHDHGRWLVKTSGSCGGHHVRNFDRASTNRSPGEYYQRFVGGPCLSALFLAGAQRVQCCGYAAQLRWHPAPPAPFRYEGACTAASLPAAFTAAIHDLATALATELGLRGCFGIDFIRARDDVPVLLDVNPRPTASLDLRPDIGRILDAHLRACATGELLYSRSRGAGAAGHIVLYADAAWQVPAGFRWPAAAVDRCTDGTRVAVGMPLCTLRVRAARSRDVLRDLARAYDAFRAAVESHTPGVLPPITRITRVGET